MAFILTVTVNYPHDEKTFEASAESEPGCNTPGEAIDTIISREKLASSFVFVISRTKD